MDKETYVGSSERLDSELDFYARPNAKGLAVGLSGEFPDLLVRMDAYAYSAMQFSGCFFYQLPGGKSPPPWMDGRVLITVLH